MTIIRKSTLRNRIPDSDVNEYQCWFEACADWLYISFQFTASSFLCLLKYVYCYALVPFLSWFHSLVVLHAVVALKLALRDGMYFRVISLASVTYVKYAGMIFTMRQFSHDPLFLINLNKYLSWYLLSGSPDIWLYHDLRLIKARARPTNRPLIYGIFIDDIACVDAFLI